MFRKNLWIVCAIVLFSAWNADAYFFSSTNGPDILLFVARANATGKLAVTSEFKYAAPGIIGATALLPAPGTTATKKIFDLFATYVDPNGKPAVFRDRLEFDETTQTWTHVSRKLFPTHKLDSFNTFSASVSPTGAQRFLLTENGPNVNRRKVNASGNLSGGNKAAFKNATQLDPLAAALSPDGAFAVQSSFTRAGSVSAAAGNQTMSFGLHLIRLANRQLANFGVANELINLGLAVVDDVICMAFRELERSSPTSATGEAAAADRSGVYRIDFHAGNLQPLDQPSQISKKAATPLTQYEVFGTTIMLPDGKGILFGKHKKGKLEFRVQGFNGGCGPNIGKPYKILSRTNPAIANNNPLYGWAAAICTYPGLC